MKIYSLEKIDELSGGDPEFAEAIVTAFLEETPQDLDSLQEGIVSEDYTTIYQSAHKLKPNVDLLGVSELHANILKMESMARSNAEMEHLKQLFVEVKATMNDLLNQLKRDFDH
ncbi:Hpt domain-containing protein [Sungkyunkwania multivorans]|uniref:Hpt domain-containing protein n=1 Tax=Sungkyunkwania multivorans TaxID=1173618 RepID=A0ABW3D2V7_9FLAO